MQPKYPVYLLLGSNIQPEANLEAAIRLLRGQVELHSLSPVWETPAVGSNGPNFLNLVAEIQTPMEIEALKLQVLRPIETRLGRVRTPDKNAPRTIDLDIIIYDKIIMDPNIWRQAHIACPLASLLPDLVEPQTGIPLSRIAARLQQNVFIRLRADVIIMA